MFCHSLIYIFFRFQFTAFAQKIRRVLRSSAGAHCPHLCTSGPSTILPERAKTRCRHLRVRMEDEEARLRHSSRTTAEYLKVTGYFFDINMYPQTPQSLVIQVLTYSKCNMKQTPTKNPRECYSRRKLKPE